MEEAQLIYFRPLTARTRQYNKNTQSLSPSSSGWLNTLRVPSIPFRMESKLKTCELLKPCLMECHVWALHYTLLHKLHMLPPSMFSNQLPGKKTPELPLAVSGITNATRRQLSVERVMTICWAFHVNTALQFPRWEQNKELCCTERMSGLLKSFSKHAGVSERRSRVATRLFLFCFFFTWKFPWCKHDFF